MDVTSLLFALALVGQTAGDRYPNYTTPAPMPGSANLSPPAYAAPPASPGYPPAGVPTSGVPTAAPPGYPPPSSATNPSSNSAVFTAAAPRRDQVAPGNASSGSPAGLPTSSSAPMATPVPLGSSTSPSSSAITGGNSGAASTSVAAPTIPDSSRAAELVREAIDIPKTVPIEGRSVTLVEALSSLGDRRRQLDAVVAYWNLAADVAEYHYAWQQTQFLEHLQKTTSAQGNNQTTAAEVGSRLATAQAQLNESKLRLYDAQFDLAQRAWVGDAAARPLPVDVPHTGSYKTQFERLFAGRSPPARAVLLNRTLPLRQQVVNVRADGVWAAQNAYEQAFGSFQRGQLPAEDVLAALDDFRTQRSEFVTAVRRYNEEIAEYALTAAPDGIGAATLVGMLIKNASKPAEGTVSDASFDGPFIDVDVAPATFIESPNSGSPSFGTPTLAPPLASPQPDPISAPASNNFNSDNSTTIAPPSNALPAGFDQLSSPQFAAPVGYSASVMNAQPQAQPPGLLPAANDAAPLSPGSVPPPITPEMQRPASSFGGSLPVANAPSSGGTPSGTPTSNPLRGQPTLAPAPTVASNPYATSPSSAGSSNPYTTPSSSAPTTSAPPPGLLPPFAPPASSGSPPAGTLPTPLPQTRYRVHTTNYGGEASTGISAQQTQELVESLYDPQGTPIQGTAISLEDCLSQVSSAERPRVLAAYWSAAEQRARYRVWSQTMETLQRVGGSNPSVQSALLAAEAERTTTLAALETARWRLTDELRRPLDEPWLLPNTLPHGGRYKTKPVAQSASSTSNSNTSNSTSQRAAERLPSLYESLQWRVSAVLSARTAASSVVDRFASQQTTAHIALSAVDRQARETCELLNVTTRYNLAIADYALGVLPASTPKQELIGALVVGRNAVASRP